MIIGNRIKLVGFSERDILPNIQDWLGRDQIRWLYAEYPVFHHIEREHFSRFAMAIHTMNEDQPIGWVDLRAYDEFNRSFFHFFPSPILIPIKPDVIVGTVRMLNGKKHESETLYRCRR